MAANRDPLAGKRLDSWKEIALFFSRGERTVKRWESERGLPVHRVPGSGRGTVFAYSDELAHWLTGRSPDLEADDPAIEAASFPESAKIGSIQSDAGEGVTVAIPYVAPPTAAPRRASGIVMSIAIWLFPVALLGVLALIFYSGPRGLRFKAQAGTRVPNAEAQDLYLKGRYYWNRRTPDDLNKAVGYFTQAIVKDPSDAAAYVGLADCYNLLREFGTMPPGEAYPRALAAAQRAVELDDTSAEAHSSLAFVTFWWSWQAATAEREFKRALELDPNFVRGHHWYATSLLAVSRFPEGLDQIEKARQLEPSSAAILADKGYGLWFGGRQSEGMALLQQLEITEPTLSSTHDYLARIYWERNDYSEAIKEGKRSAELRHDNDALAIATAQASGFAAGGLQGMFEEELPLQKESFARGSGSAYLLAETCAALGKKTEALAYLQAAFDKREAGMLRIKIDTRLSTLRGEPAFQELAKQVDQRLLQ